MVIPVYKKISKHERNLCNDVTAIYECEGNQGVSELHNLENDLCNQEPRGYPEVLSEGYTVTQVTPSKSKEYWIDKFEEKSAIYEYEANLEKQDAEIKAFDELIIEYMDKFNDHSLDKAVRRLLSYGIKHPFYNW